MWDRRASCAVAKYENGLERFKASFFFDGGVQVRKWRASDLRGMVPMDRAEVGKLEASRRMRQNNDILYNGADRRFTQKEGWWPRKNNTRTIGMDLLSIRGLLYPQFHW